VVEHVAVLESFSQHAEGLGHGTVMVGDGTNLPPPPAPR
jgi:hypothetical protein